jgi:hypothetical protein
MAKLIFKKHADPSKKLEIINYDNKINDLKMHINNKKLHFQISLVLNIVQLAVLLYLIIK